MQNPLIFIFALLSVVIFSNCASTSGNNDCIDASKINKNIVCTTNYDPVCGCDNKTYGNSCNADREGVTSYKPGECPE